MSKYFKVPHAYNGEIVIGEAKEIINHLDNQYVWLRYLSDKIEYFDDDGDVYYKVAINLPLHFHYSFDLIEEISEGEILMMKLTGELND